MDEEIKLTQFSKGGGCGCKIAPSVLQQILKTEDKVSFASLLVGNESSDDAAVYQIQAQSRHGAQYQSGGYLNTTKVHPPVRAFLSCVLPIKQESIRTAACIFPLRCSLRNE